MTAVRAAEKYFWLSWPVTATPAAMISSAITPEARPIRAGTPVRADTRPRNRGPAPSRQAAAWARPAPMIQAAALDISTQMNNQPGERLPAAGGHRADRVGHDHRRE